ncbi:MAG: patatin-like phospholipase family protein [Bdellovibrionaceae bacterium]|nr:patatin-like phospholipase family protein [Pseudobdellovibrionaceae bacterium]
MNFSDKTKPALVLSGGGVKAAAFHLGVCLALREKGFKFAGGNAEKVKSQFPDDKMTIKTYVGSSAGSLISTFLAAGYTIESIIEAFIEGAGSESFIPKRYTSKKDQKLKPITYRDIFAMNVRGYHPARFLPSLMKKQPVITGGLEVLLKKGFKVNGIFSTRNIERYFREHVLEDNSFESLGVQLYVIATQLNYSRKVIFSDFEESYKDDDVKKVSYAKISEAVAASASLPPVFRPYGIKNASGKENFFFDGEIRDTLSTHVAADHGADLVIASYSIQPYHYHEDMGSLHEYGMPIILNQALYQAVEQKINKHRKHRTELRNLVNAVHGYLKEIDLPQENRDKLMDILIDKTNYKPNVEYLYIHPSAQNYKMFFYDHFSLNPDILAQIVRVGFKTAMFKLRRYKF